MSTTTTNSQQSKRSSTSQQIGEKVKKNLKRVFSRNKRPSKDESSSQYEESSFSNTNREVDEIDAGREFSSFSRHGAHNPESQTSSQTEVLPTRPTRPQILENFSLQEILNIALSEVYHELFRLQKDDIIIHPDCSINFFITRIMLLIRIRGANTDFAQSFFHTFFEKSLNQDEWTPLIDICFTRILYHCRNFELNHFELGKLSEGVNFYCECLEFEAMALSLDQNSIDMYKDHVTHYSEMASFEKLIGQPLDANYHSFMYFFSNIDDDDSTSTPEAFNGLKYIFLNKEYHHPINLMAVDRDRQQSLVKDIELTISGKQPFNRHSIELLIEKLEFVQTITHELAHYTLRRKESNLNYESPHRFHISNPKLESEYNDDVKSFELISKSENEEVQPGYLIEHSQYKGPIPNWKNILFYFQDLRSIAVTNHAMDPLQTFVQVVRDVLIDNAQEVHTPSRLYLEQWSKLGANIISKRCRIWRMENPSNHSKRMHPVGNCAQRRCGTVIELVPKNEFPF